MPSIEYPTMSNVPRFYAYLLLHMDEYKERESEQI